MARKNKSMQVVAAAEDPALIKPSALPTGRVSVDNTGTSFADMIREFAGEFNWINPKYPIEYLGVMQTLSLVNADISQMVQNVVHLGNTGHTLRVDAGGEAQEQKIIDELNSFNSRVFYRYGGLDGFINSGFGQVARGGAISVEWVPEKSLNGLEKVVFVPLCSIRFRLNRESGEYEAYQKLSGIGASGLENQIELNPYTYQYIALQLLDNSPYAIPPILAALEAVMIQKDILRNFRFVAKKFGLLGFTSYLLKAPQKIPGEKDDAYIGRMKKYLADQGEMLRHNNRDGIFVGFQGSHEVKHQPMLANAQGAGEIHRMTEEQVFSGMNSDPALHGRTYSTTETYAGVVYEKMLSILVNYQRPIRNVLEYGYKLHLNLVGLRYKSLEVEFQPNKSLSAERDETTYATKVTTLRGLYADGIIDQDQYAKEAGYDAPALPGPRTSEDNVPEEDVKANAYRFSKRAGSYVALKKKTAPAATQSAIDDIFESLTLDPAGCSCGFGHGYARFADRKSGKIAEFVSKYFRAVFPSLRNSRNEAVKAASEAAGNFPKTGDADLFADHVFDSFDKGFKRAVDASALASKIKTNVNTAYKYFRMEDQEPFKNNKYNPSNKNPIKPKFNLVDGQAVKYVRDSDQFYFGRYVTDPKTKEALQNWLSKDWLKSGRSLQDPGELKLFRQRFGDRVGKEDYKIRRVVETSVSRSKNWGNILTVEQSGGTRVEIAGPDDNRICDWCRSMLGKEYELAPVVKHIKHVMSRPPEEIPDIAPFVTNVLTPTETKAASVDDLLKLGITLPPYHPSCRHRFIVSKFDD